MTAKVSGRGPVSAMLLSGMERSKLRHSVAFCPLVYAETEINVKKYIYIHFFLIWSQGNFSQAQQHRHHCYNVNRATGVFLETGDFPRSILRMTFFLNAKRETILIISNNICITNNENSRPLCCERVIEIYPSAKYASVHACIADCDK